MTTITKERLLTIKQWRETYGPGSNVVLPAEEAEELARIALASLEAKPIGAFHIAEQQVDGTSDYIKDGEWPIDNGTIEVYATPPAPVVPEEKPMPNPLGMYAVDAVAAIAEVRGWNACRAAMLQAGNFRENKDSSTNNFREITETSTNSPVTPDGWISCSERMPEDTKMLLAFSQGEIVAAYWNWVVNPIDYKKYRAFTYLSGYILDDVTHWMPLPEPPQEVK
ncbi:TPA: DUF551 domain-containing protein [Escherichia coli]|nr:DUF551 domain-containing protein [Escherichia coli]EFE7088637.1 DUF551 domain-containing protein [Escherichia coli]MCN7811200.1 DUF551 domain-containing protein [Escherichia coli]HAL0226364.1 DUF551 domain-containing protein [Escherichia coli]HBC7131279.1 DUF551 domain-containing protein [Escherichia coli]